MTTFAEQFMAQANDRADIAQKCMEDSAIMRLAHPGRKFRTSVSYTGDFRRIEALPRRKWEDNPPEAGQILTEELKTPQGTMALWPAQVAALYDITLLRGGFIPVGVGQGKALISLLAPVVLEAKRPLLIVPAQLREQTKKYVIPEMSLHWKLHPNLTVIGYSELSLAKNADLLERLNPDLIISDECHRIKNKRAGRTRRLVRWFRDHPETMCVAMSGTISNRSLRDFGHIIQWCLGDGTPLPQEWRELTSWADAIDEKVPEDQRAGAGALWRLGEPGDNARGCFRSRFTETPGVVATQADALGVSLRIERLPVTIPPKVATLIHTTRETWMTPNGDPITEAVSLWRQMRELALGFWYRWSPPAPREWMDARREWKTYVRETLAHNRRQLDTELQVWTECQKQFVAGELPDVHPWNGWEAIKGSFKPNSVAEWVDPFALEACKTWLDECTDKEPGICWVEQRAFGERLAAFTGRPYFGAGDNSILATQEPAIIASIAAHGEGKNLFRFCRALVTAPMASGKTWEQLLGREHRKGQQADEVATQVFLHLQELESSFEQARADAIYLEDSFGNKQKLNYADIVI